MEINVNTSYEKPTNPQTAQNEFEDFAPPQQLGSQIGAGAQTIATRPIGPGGISQAQPVRASMASLSSGVQNANDLNRRRIGLTESLQKMPTREQQPVKVIPDLNDILATTYPVVQPQSRLIVKVMMTRSDFANLKAIRKDLSGVQASSGQMLNYFSPIKLRKEDSFEGFARKPILNLLKLLDSSNSRPVRIANESNIVESLFKPFTRSIGDAIYEKFGTDDMVLEYVQDEDPEAGDVDEEGNKLLNSDSGLLSSDFINSEQWVSYSISPDGDADVNFTQCLEIQSAEAYATRINLDESGEKTGQLVMIDRIKKMINGAIEKHGLDTLTVVFAVVFNTESLLEPTCSEIAQAISAELVPADDGEDGVEGGDRLRYTKLTYNKVVDYAEQRLSTFVEGTMSPGDWDEEDEFLPMRSEDVGLLIKPDEIMFYECIALNGEVLMRNNMFDDE